MDKLTEQIKEWAMDRNLHLAVADKQFLKLIEEVGELAEGMVKFNREQVIDSIGDIYVVLTILAMQMDLEMEECVEHSYNEIKDRKGMVIGGTFIKEEDL